MVYPYLWRVFPPYASGAASQAIEVELLMRLLACCELNMNDMEPEPACWPIKGSIFSSAARQIDKPEMAE